LDFWRTTLTNDKDMVLTTRFGFALAYAMRLHATQLRKGTTNPSVPHLLAVASLVLEADGAEDEMPQRAPRVA
jgi:(p)ppGpp synthase/HD superfamily hydrolase